MTDPVADLNKLKDKRKRINKNLKVIENGLIAEQEKLAHYNKEITKVEVMKDMNMTGDDEFDIDMLLIGKESIVENIKSIENCILLEKSKLAKCEQEIGAAEAILGLHGQSLVCMSEEDHDWEIIENFPLSGNWKKRRCRKCQTEQRLGHG